MSLDRGQAVKGIRIGDVHYFFPDEIFDYP